MARVQGNVVTVDELLSAMHHRKQARPAVRATPSPAAGSVNKPGTVSKKSPLVMIILGLLVVALGAMIILTHNELTSLKAEVTELKGLKAHLIAADPKLRLASIDSKLDAMAKEKESLKVELTGLKDYVENLKITKTNGKKLTAR